MLVFNIDYRKFFANDLKKCFRIYLYWKSPLTFGFSLMPGINWLIGNIVWYKKVDVVAGLPTRIPNGHRKTIIPNIV